MYDRPITGYTYQRKRCLDLQNRWPCMSEVWSELVFRGHGLGEGT